MSVGLILSAVLAYYFLRRVDLGQLGSTLGSVNLWILSCCVLTKGAVFSLGALRSKVFLKPLRSYSFAECFAPVLGGYVTNNIFPFRLGELVRIDLLARAGGLSRGSTVAVAALERLLDLVSFLILFAVVVPLLAIDISGDRRLAWALGALLSTLLAVVWLVAWVQCVAVHEGGGCSSSAHLCDAPDRDAHHPVLALGIRAGSASVRPARRDGLSLDRNDGSLVPGLYRHVSCRGSVCPGASGGRTRDGGFGRNRWAFHGHGSLDDRWLVRESARHSKRLETRAQTRRIGGGRARGIAPPPQRW